MNESTFVPIGVLFSHFNNLDLTLVDCSIYTRIGGKNIYQLDFYVENHENTFPCFKTKYINTRTEKKYFSFMVGKKFTENDIPDFC